MRENKLDRRLAAIETRSPEQLKELQERMENHTAAELETLRLEYRAARIFGAAALVAGLGLATAGNLVA